MEPEIDITPEMISAGIEAYDSGFGFGGEILGSTADFVCAIFLAKATVKSSSGIRREEGPLRPPGAH